MYLRGECTHDNRDETDKYKEYHIKQVKYNIRCNILIMTLVECHILAA